ncbi:MAG: asparagine synthase (glutamine-hydrolyzing) [Acidobacteriota bacterium]
MCGITGFWDPSFTGNSEDLTRIARRMAGAIAHRGPDDAGDWSDVGTGMAMGFRRLSVIDLSPEGHQPMTSASGRYVIAFNGEVYNFERLRRTLAEEGRSQDFRGHSDTEVLLAAIEAWGLEAAVQKFIGMFAIALWDRRERQLSLVRDRIGVKPLYYGWSKDTLLFGSELKALREHPHFPDTIDRNAVADLVQRKYIGAPRSIYRDIKKLGPGTILQISGPGRTLTIEYWSPRVVATNGLANPFPGSVEEATDRLDDLLRDSVALRMVADVPVGVFLSGGIDSSLIAGLMQANSRTPVRTFTVGFRDDTYDEAPYAARVAAHLGTDHTELYVTADEALDVVPKLALIYDEPFADASQIPTCLVSVLARQHVTVTLSGDGGDELFGGYDRYAFGRAIWSAVGWMPAWLRQFGARKLRSWSPAANDTTFRLLHRFLPARLQTRASGEKIHRLAAVMTASDYQGMYRRLVSDWAAGDGLLLEGGVTPEDDTQWLNVGDATSRMMYHDLVTYLPDDILVKVDRASMAASLEAREPLLDHRLIEFAWRLPMAMKTRGGHSKWLLRQVLHRHVPEALLARRKMGFGVPLQSWLRGPLRSWAEELLAPKRIQREGFFVNTVVAKTWADHLSGKQDHSARLWSILMFQAWLDTRPSATIASAATGTHTSDR